MNEKEIAYREGYAKGYADAKKNEKHGRWEKKAAYNDGVLNTVACSVCKTYQPVGSWDYYPYCPHCGNPMDLPNITENTRKALDKMGENVHSEIEFDYAAEDEL